jgi:phage-related tail fiber protein
MTPDSQKKSAKKIPVKKKVTTKTAVSARETPVKKVAKKTTVKAKEAPTTKAVKKTTAKPKETTTKKVAKKSTIATKPQTSSISISSEERWKMIAIAAYHNAEKRGFAPGGEMQDWAEAEKEIDELLMSG